MENRQQLALNIVAALSNSLNPNNQVRQQAEEFIKQAERQPGYASSLLEISATPSFNQGQQIDISHAAAVQLGKIVDYHWKFLTVEQAQKVAIEGFEYIILDPADKALVRDNIMRSLYMTQNRQIVKQYMRCITTIARSDYPDQWPNLLPQIGELIVQGQQGDDKALITGLQGLKGLVKKYEYEMDEEREPLHQIVAQTFSVLGGIVNQVIAVEAEKAYEVLYLIAKIFYLSNQLKISPYLSDNKGANLDPWILLLKTIMDRPVPESLESSTEDMDEIEKRDKHICWKIKGIASQCTYRLFSKYGNPKFSDESLEEFSGAFKEKYALPLLESHLQLFLKRKTQFVGSKVLNFGIKYVSQSTKMPATMAKLKPFIEQILTEVIVNPIMLLTHKDVTLFKEDPIEYVRKQFDFTDTLFAPKNTVVDLLTLLCQYKSAKKSKLPDYLKGFLQFCAITLQNYTAAISAGQTNVDWRIKEALLFAIGSIFEEIQPYKQLRVTVEPMLTTYVFGELKNPQPFLRMRALWMYGEFVDKMSFKDDAHLKEVTLATYQALHSDPELPVRLTAATSMKHLLNIDSACDLLKPNLGHILTAYLKLMSEIESEELVNALEEIVSLYHEDIGPFAIQLTEQLVASYHRLVHTNPDDDDGESALAAQGCMVTIGRIIDSVSKNAELIHKIEEIALPMFMFGLTPDGMDSIEDALNCITMILYHGLHVSERMWKVYPQLLYLICGDEKDPDGGYGFEYISQIGVALQNFISKDPETFLKVGEGQTQTYIAMTFRFIDRALMINATSEHMLDGICIMKVLIAMLENLGNGRINEALPLILKVCSDQLNLGVKKIPKNYISMVVQTLCMCFWYNAQLTFQVLDLQMGQTIPMFQRILQTLPTLEHDFELRRVIFGLSAILSTPIQALPSIVGQRMPDIAKNLAGLCHKMREERLKVLKDNEEYCDKEEEKRKKGGHDSDDSEGDGFEDAEGDEEGDNSDEDDENAILNKLSNFKKNQKNTGGSILDNNDDDDYDEEDDSDYEFTGGDLAIYDSALDDVDELLFVKEQLERLNAHDAAYTQQLLGAMTPEEQAQFSEIMRSAQELKDREEVVRKRCDVIDKVDTSSKRDNTAAAEK